MTSIPLPTMRQDIIAKFATFAESIVNNESIKKATATPQIFRFHDTDLPSVSLNQYVTNIAKKTKVSWRAFIIATVYLTRVDVILNDFTVHRLCLIALVLGSKMCEEEDCPDMDAFAAAAGLGIFELFDMEDAMIGELGFLLGVNGKQFQAARLALASTSCHLVSNKPVTSKAVPKKLPTSLFRDDSIRSLTDPLDKGDIKTTLRQLKDDVAVDVAIRFVRSYSLKKTRSRADKLRTRKPSMPVLLEMPFEFDL